MERIGQIIMNRIVTYLLLVICQLVWVANEALGAAITMADLPYLCDFEDASENANWTLNPSINTITTTNAWVIGDALAYTGERSLYVSQDGGVTNTYASTNNVLLAYRDITLEAGDYDVAYDWTGMGNKTKGYLKVIYANRPTSGLKCLGNSVEPSYVSTSVQLMGNNASLVGGDAWRHVQARVTIPVAQANKTTTRLLFVWVSTDVTVTEAPTSVAIDNFQLAKAPPADDYPTNIHVTTVLNNSTIEWEGSADAYEVLYRKKTDSEFTSVPVEGNSVTLQNVDYGAYEFWICAVNGEDKTIYTIFPVVYIYQTDCFDALNMYNASFEWGGWQHSKGKEVKGTDRVDYGPGDVRSRHTTHFDLTETDPRTEYYKNGQTVALRTVPSGEFGSVRLGNWNTGSEYESMTFHYTVESSSMAVLLIKYAMVLENPNHNAESQPRFTLDVFDEEGVSVDTKCASVDFHAPAPQEWDDPEVQALWHVSNWYSGGNNHVINWQDWKTIGISVEDFVGQTLTITLTSYDCDQGGHFGYAYFMLNCVRSDVDGLPWGEGSTTQMFTAPQGFDYAWFNRTDQLFQDTIDNTNPAKYPYITDEGRYFYILESDTNTYICHVTYPTNPECGYWFDASGKPHTPKAEMDIRWTPSECTNGFTWWNRCHVVLTNQLTGEEEHRYDKQLENCFLIVDGEEIPVSYDENGVFVPMPDEGGTVRYGIWTGIYVKNQLYADTAWYEMEIPAIGPLQTDMYAEICRGDVVYFPEGSQTKCTEPGDYFDNLQSVVTGCDSTVILHLTVHEPLLTDVYDTICEGHTYVFNGETLTTSGRRTAIFNSLVTGCDSVVTLNLNVAPRPRHTLLTELICADDALVLKTSNSQNMDSLYLVVDRAEGVHPAERDGDLSRIYFDNVLAGVRTAYIYTTMPWCDDVYEEKITFNVSLPSSIIEARFDDVLAFLSPAYNGGYTFTSYQWYANGQPIEGATGSYYYNTGMDKDAEITVSATLQDGTTVWVCPFTFNTASRPDALDDVRATGKAVKLLRDGQLVIRYGDSEFDALGRRIQ